MNKTLVTYFSATGVTAKAANELTKAIGADIFEIKPKIPYTKADLNWMDKQSRTSVEMKDKTYRPEIADEEIDINKYDVVFVGFPKMEYSL